ncbi:MAG: LTA synthase family protein [Clostridia bacterium]|nr:LTA synthase family protein [Clostridia bacterium]
MFAKIWSNLKEWFNFKKWFETIKSWGQIKRYKDKKHLIIYGIIAAAFAAICLLLSVHWATSIISGVVVFFFLQFRLEITDKFPVWIQSIIMVALSLLVFILMQVTISCGVLLIGGFKFIMNLILFVGLICTVWLITGKLKIAVIAITVLSQILAIADHLVVQARSFEIQFSDFFSLGTAAQVADQYKFELSEITKIGIILSVLFITFIVMTKFPERERNWKQFGVCMAGFVCGVLCVVVIYTQVGASVISYQDKYWKFRGSERNGFLVNMIYSASATRVLVPEGYDAESLENMVDGFEGNITEGEDDTKRRPNVIVIMNETFTDVSNITEYLGGNVPTNIPVTPFLDSLDDSAPNIIKGHALSSVYGGNTANSELEFLTGLSIQFIPRNTVAYNLYINEGNSFTMVDAFKEAGYNTVAIHPENPTNWQRDTIYDYFGFDEQYFKDAFDGLEENEDNGIYRGHVSDGAVYDKIIDLFENKEEGEPLFNFTITMQNHSGYNTLGFDHKVDIEGMSTYYGIREYLTSINNSDRALKRLIEYFSSVEEETVIVFFGDHQPSLSNVAGKFYGLNDDSSTKDQLAKYVVPYFFWANYNIDEDVDDDRDPTLTSINFLSTRLRDLVDIPETEFNVFVDKLNSKVMAMNAMGWFDWDYNFHESAYSTPDLSDGLKLYNYLQYNMMFDSTNKMEELYSVVKKN